MTELNPFKYLVFSSLPAGNNQSHPKFKMGDKVYHVPSSSPGTVGNTGDVVGGVWTYWISSDTGGGTYHKEYELIPASPKIPDWKWGDYKCECGSDVTYGVDSNTHAVYCPKHRS